MYTISGAAEAVHRPTGPTAASVYIVCSGFSLVLNQPQGTTIIIHPTLVSHDQGLKGRSLIQNSAK